MFDPAGRPPAGPPQALGLPQWPAGRLPFRSATANGPLRRRIAPGHLSALERGDNVKKLVQALLTLGMLASAVPAGAQGIEWETLNDEVVSLHRQGRYDRAVKVARKALEVAEANVGPDHPAVATSLNNLAGLYKAQGQYAQAEPLYQRSLAIREKALGPDHPDVAGSLNNLAGLYRAQGQYAQAEPLYKRSLAIKEKALGPDHPDVATSLENMAALYRKTGREKEATALDQRAAAIRAMKR
jgi:tetratricopeptide (TPR) repeat protein